MTLIKVFKPAVTLKDWLSQDCMVWVALSLLHNCDSSSDNKAYQMT